MDDTELEARLDQLAYQLAECHDLIRELDPLVRAAAARLQHA